MNLFKTGDRVVALIDHHQGFFGLGDTGTVRSEDPRFVDSYFVKFDHQDILSNPISVSESQLQLIKTGMTGSGIKFLGPLSPSNPTFKPGDIAVYIRHDGLLFSYGELLEIMSQDLAAGPNFWEVLSTSTGMQCTVSEDALQSQNAQAPQKNYGVPYGGTYNISLPPGLTVGIDKLNDSIHKGIGAMKLSWDEPKKHKCDWKTYTGLMYKEEYCDCGQTKNRRGIYE